MMQSKSLLTDFVSEKYYIHDGKLFILTNSEEDAYDHPETLKRINGRFNRFKRMNAAFEQTRKLLPDSVFTNFMKQGEQ